jgi:hypothetical protein
LSDKQRLGESLKLQLNHKYIHLLLFTCYKRGCPVANLEYYGALRVAVSWKQTTTTLRTSTLPHPHFSINVVQQSNIMENQSYDLPNNVLLLPNIAAYHAEKRARFSMDRTRSDFPEGDDAAQGRLVRQMVDAFYAVSDETRKNDGVKITASFQNRTYPQKDIEFKCWELLVSGLESRYREDF